jgi:hypothetical protein
MATAIFTFVALSVLVNPDFTVNLLSRFGKFILVFFAAKAQMYF